MCFRLDTTKYQGDPSDIVNIMNAFCKDLSKKTGLSLGIYMGPTHEELEAYCKDNGLEVANEEVLGKNMIASRRIDKFVEYIEKIGGIGGELLIVDPYFFPKKFDEDYPEILVQILERANCTSIAVVTNKNNYNKCLAEKVRRETKSPIKVIFSNDFHDRFWIANKTNGFLSGTSINGVGRKFSIIEKLGDNDVKTIVELIENIAQDGSKEEI